MTNQNANGFWKFAERDWREFRELDRRQQAEVFDIDSRYTLQDPNVTRGNIMEGKNQGVIAR